MLNTLSHIPPTLVQPVQFMTFNIGWTYVASLLTGNVSQVDRVWTFLPTLYTAYFAVYPLLGTAEPGIRSQGVHPRVVLMLTLQVVWMARLSYNTWRRGLFNLKDEDYRWEILRKKISPWLFQVFNFGFIGQWKPVDENKLLSNLLLFSLGLPGYNALIRGSRELGKSDVVLTFLALLDLALEFTSDNQQWSYQNFKKTGEINLNEWAGARIKWTEDDRQRGFITRGLWAYSRHPNFSCEQSFWYIMSLFPIFASERLPELSTADFTLFWPFVPAFALSLLFISSTIFTESITASKYPEYAAYQARVAMFLPMNTPLKGMWLKITGRKVEVDRMVWGAVKGKRTE